MATPRDQGVIQIRRFMVLVPAALGLAALLGGCGSQAPAAQPVSAAAVRATCTKVSAVLSDGPDPNADPVGYAEAQILPLGQIRTSDARLRAAIGKLASAYRTFFDSNGSSSAAKLAVAAASKQVNSFCPGAAS
jgi:hypothetical protein